MTLEDDGAADGALADAAVRRVIGRPPVHDRASIRDRRRRRKGGPSIVTRGVRGSSCNEELRRRSTTAPTHSRRPDTSS
jgi:hypothetical protein